MPDRTRTRTLCFALGILGGSLALAGCPKEPEVSQAGPAGPGSAAQSQPAKPAGAKATPEARVTPPPTIRAQEIPAAAKPEAVSAGLQDVFFDFDRAVIRDDQRTALNGDFTWLRDHSKAKVTIEGYCDERGTEEYNLALGQRRAQAVKDYLVAAGVPGERIGTISYGKDRVLVPGHDESAWSQNRRARFATGG